MIINYNSILDGSKGVQRYFEELVKEGVLDGTNASFLKSRTLPSRLYQVVWSLFNFREKVWSPSHATSILSANHVVTVHDLINLENMPSWSPRFILVYLNLFFVFFVCKRIVCISESSRSQVLHYFPFVSRKLSVLKSPTLVKCSSYGEPESAFLSQLKGKKFVLVISNELPHKNNAFVMSGLSRKAMEYSYDVVLIGIGESAVKENVDSQSFCHFHLLGGVSDAEIDWLFRNAALVVSGSFLEGHNLVIAQALTCGRKVLCSSIPVHKEFYSDFVDFFDPVDMSDYESGIDRAFSCSASELLALSNSGRLKNCRTFSDLASDYRKFFSHIGVC